ncbi:MAG: CocE/NonD family hydrolase [Acidobacteria bacterium]|nr:CocE/NonD family hydrolase [Acidobacteriota bacterium]
MNRHRIFHTVAALLFLAIFQLPVMAQAGSANSERVRAGYTKYEYLVPMRDGIRLFTSVYVPKDRTRPYPFLLTRTPYSVGPYGVDNYRSSLGPSEQFEKEGFIFVYQDARGRYMSEGEFQQVRPHIPVKASTRDIDESSDTFDSIEWLLKNVPNNNGRVGMVGISQPGFHVAASIIDSHPALKCASPQAPTADYYMGDDVYHNGAFMLAANFWFYSSFRPRNGGPELPKQRGFLDPGTPDGYDFFLKLGALSEVNRNLFNGEAAYWQEIVDHPNYDEFWQKRSLWKFMNNVKCAVLNVGGWFDAEDPMGPFYTYNSIEKKNPGTDNFLVMGPWSHGGWSRGDGDKLGNVNFAVKTGAIFREEVQFSFFMKHLKDKPAEIAEATMYLTGLNEWRRLAAWPPKEAHPVTFYFRADGKLKTEAPAEIGNNAFDEYLSDPNRPVHYLGYIVRGMTSDYMTDDQRHASQRPDVLVYQTEPLAEDLTIAGPIKVSLNVSTSGTDSDFVVKLIDVYPGDYPTPTLPPNQQAPANSVKMGGYQQLVRGEPFRGKFRRGFEKPEPFIPNKAESISFDMPDVFHTFRKGHRLMVHVQSSWFPLVDRNPQKFTDIPKARPEDFQKATNHVFRSKSLNSSVTVLVAPGN